MSFVSPIPTSFPFRGSRHSKECGKSKKHEKKKRTKVMVTQDASSESFERRLKSLIGQTVTLVLDGTSPIIVLTSFPSTTPTTSDPVSITIIGTVLEVDAGTVSLINVQILFAVTSSTPTFAPLGSTQPTTVSLSHILSMTPLQ